IVNSEDVRVRIFNRACEKAGLHRRPLHATRHTFATLLLQQGRIPVYVKEQMRQSSISGRWISTSTGYRASRDTVNRLPSICVHSSVPGNSDNFPRNAPRIYGPPPPRPL